MRTRRQFRPMFDQLTLRIAPSGGICADPMDGTSNPNAPPPIVNPMDPTWTLRRTPPTPDCPMPAPPTQATVSPPVTTLC